LVLKNDVWTWIGVVLNVVNFTKDYCNNIILMVKKIDNREILSKFKNTHNLKDMDFFKKLI
jgi:hypothetical protein